MFNLIAVQVAKMVTEETGSRLGIIKRMPLLIDRILHQANVTMNDLNVKKVLNEEKFDLVIIGYFMYQFALGNLK